jgi:hypothetical protein
LLAAAGQDGGWLKELGRVGVQRSAA